MRLNTDSLFYTYRLDVYFYGYNSWYASHMRMTMPFTSTGDFVVAIPQIAVSGRLIQSRRVYDDGKQTGRCDGDNDDGEDPTGVDPHDGTLFLRRTEWRGQKTRPRDRC